MKTDQKAGDQRFWQDRIGPDEILLWYERPSYVIFSIKVFLVFVICGFGAYFSYQNIFIYSSVDEACKTTQSNTCEIFFYLAWPLLILQLLICAVSILLPLALRMGWLIHRYAITNRKAYLISTGILNIERSASLFGAPPVRMMGKALKFSDKLAFSGLTDSEIESATAAVSKAQRGAL